MPGQLSRHRFIFGLSKTLNGEWHPLKCPECLHKSTNTDTRGKVLNAIVAISLSSKCDGPPQQTCHPACVILAPDIDFEPLEKNRTTASVTESRLLRLSSVQRRTDTRRKSNLVADEDVGHRKNLHAHTSPAHLLHISCSPKVGIRLGPLNMSKPLFDRSWIWHPTWVEDVGNSKISGRFVHFRRNIKIPEPISEKAIIRISADTKYRLFINSKFVHRGPVKGDEYLWFYDELDITSHLRTGVNHIAIEVLRLYHATPSATSFVRLSAGGGLFVQAQNKAASPAWLKEFDTNDSWECAIDTLRYLRSDAEGDHFLHVFESFIDEPTQQLQWEAAKSHNFLNAFGIKSPWKLSARMIPFFWSEHVAIGAVHNVKSSYSIDTWNQLFSRTISSLTLAPGTVHYFEIEMMEHVTADLSVSFQRPRTEGGRLEIKYSECYEDQPTSTFARNKGNRRDISKGIYGPSDHYRVHCLNSYRVLHHFDAESETEVISPFHFRTFRVVGVTIVAPADSELVFHGLEIEKTNYSLDIKAQFQAYTGGRKIELEDSLFDVSLRTLRNCMHDCYEDCPFFEQLQYAMDARSCALFTYLVSGDDRLARQAITQLHNSFQPALGLTASRAPCPQLQIIPNFSLFWVLMVTDHFEYYADQLFTRRFLPVVNAVLDSFAQRIDAKYQLVRCYDDDLGLWDFVDWTDNWKPFGEVPAARRTGFQTVANAIYAHALGRVAELSRHLGRKVEALELEKRKHSINTALRIHCFDGAFFTDGLNSMKQPDMDLSIHSQIWAVLSGAATGEAAIDMLNHALGNDDNSSSSGLDITRPSTAMSFYTLRALSMLSRDLYNTHYHRFWQPWKTQLAQNVTTWVEDNINQRSDCHAWGSSPLHEFLAEVAGVRPGAPGWSVIEFAPRVELYEQIDARVVVKGADIAAVAHVKWTSKGKSTNVEFELEPMFPNSSFDLPRDLKIRVRHRDGGHETVVGSHKFSCSI